MTDLVVIWSDRKMDSTVVELGIDLSSFFIFLLIIFLPEFDHRGDSTCTFDAFHMRESRKQGFGILREPRNLRTAQRI